MLNYLGGKQTDVHIYCNTHKQDPLLIIRVETKYNKMLCVLGASLSVLC